MVIFSGPGFSGAAWKHWHFSTWNENRKDMKGESKNLGHQPLKTWWIKISASVFSSSMWACKMGIITGCSHWKITRLGWQNISSHSLQTHAIQARLCRTIQPIDLHKACWEQKLLNMGWKTWRTRLKKHAPSESKQFPLHDWLLERLF